MKGGASLIPMRSHCITQSHLPGCIGSLGRQGLWQNKHCFLKSKSCTCDLRILTTGVPSLSKEPSFLLFSMWVSTIFCNLLVVLSSWRFYAHNKFLYCLHLERLNWSRSIAGWSETLSVTALCFSHNCFLQRKMSIYEIY